MGIESAAAGFILIGVGLAMGYVLARLTLRLKEVRLRDAIRRAEILLNIDAVDAAEKVNASLQQIEAARDATIAAADDARAAEDRVAALAKAFRSLRDDEGLARIAAMRRLERKPPTVDR